MIGRPPGIDLILFGSMGSGKTTLGRILARERGRVVVSAQDVIRRHLDGADEPVRKLRQAGFLLPDALVTDWVFAALGEAWTNAKPVVLDGYPRTEVQARTLLERCPTLGRVAFLDFPVEVLRQRVENRLLCLACEMPHSRLFADFSGRCVDCGGDRFAPRPTDRPDYFQVKTSQFRSVSAAVEPVLRATGLPFVTVRDHGRFEDLRAEAIALDLPT